ncbi:protein kinase [Curvibacter sp. HBC28]|uniref:Protein kinase n=1 Tax=Curvibacter microcysteis TaxID=3026419 RepID=A0ABT5MK67_9BURK|nr:serine/threonine protein kinase [Curvibacter sp. HBC28]MDD0816972.1 protein kinase [Curvibacter sp. HBC28]
MSSPALDWPPTVLTHVDALAVGERLAEFEITGLLGVGGFGLVYRAFDHSLHRPVAIKEYMPSALAGRTQGQQVATRSSADGLAYESGLRGFLSEARLLARFDHPSLVKVFRFWEANGTAYMVMPLYQGMTLKQARQHMRSPPPEAWLRVVMGAVLGALSVLHESQTLHRDVSPDNLFLQDLGPPVLLDLGAARRAVGEQTQKHTAILKVNYAPIEQYAEAEDMHPGPWSDLYSLAAVVYDCLCNKPAPPATFRIIKDRMLPLTEVARVVEAEFGLSYSEAFVDTVSQALAIRPEQRPASTEVMAQAMGLEVDVTRLSRFDWRAELGAVWVAPGTAPVDGAAAGSGEVTTVLPAAATQVAPLGSDLDFTWPLELSADARPEAVAAPLRQPAPETTVPLSEVSASRKAPGAAPSVLRPEGMRRWRLAVAWALVLPLLGALLGWWWQHQHDPDAGIITEMAEPPRPAVMAPVAGPIPSSSPSADAPRDEAPMAAGVSSPPAPGAGAAPSALSKPAGAGAAAAGELAARKSASPLSAAAPSPGTQPPSRGDKSAAAVRGPGREDNARHSEVTPPRSAAEPAATSTPSGAALCAEASVITRTMCMHQACARPENTATAACVDYRRGMQERANRLF